MIDRVVLTVGIASFFVKAIGVFIGGFFGIVYSNLEIFWLGIGLLIFGLSFAVGMALDMLLHAYLQRKKMLNLLEQQNKLLIALGRRLTDDQAVPR